MIKFEIYKDKKKQWRWRLVAKNGKNVANGGEGYYMKFNVKRAIKKIVKDIEKGYEIVDLTKR